MNTKGIKFLAVLAVLAMAFAAFAIVTDANENDAESTATHSGKWSLATQGPLDFAATMIEDGYGQFDNVTLKNNIYVSYDAGTKTYTVKGTLAYNTIAGGADTAFERLGPASSSHNWGLAFLVKDTAGTPAAFTIKVGTGAAGDIAANDYSSSFLFIKEKKTADVVITGGNFPGTYKIDFTGVTLAANEGANPAKGNVGIPNTNALADVDNSEATYSGVGESGSWTMAVDGSAVGTLTLDNYVGGEYFSVKTVEVKLNSVVLVGNNTINTTTNDAVINASDSPGTDMVVTSSAAASLTIVNNADNGKGKCITVGAQADEGSSLTLGNTTATTITFNLTAHDRALNVDKNITIRNATVTAIGGEKCICSQRAGLSITNSTVTASLGPEADNNEGTKDRFAVKAVTLSVDADSTLTTDGLRVTSSEASSLNNSGIITVSGDYVQSPEAALDKNIAGLYYPINAATKVTAYTAAPADKPYILLTPSAETYGNIEVQNASGKTVEENVNATAAAQATIAATVNTALAEATVEKVTVDVSEVVDLGATPIAVSGTKTVEINTIGAATITAKMTVGNDQTLKFTDVKGNFQISKGSTVIVIDEWTAGTIEVGDGDTVKISGEVGGDVSFVITGDSPTKSAKFIIEKEKSLVITGENTLTFPAGSNVTVSGTLAGKVSNAGTITVATGGDITLAAITNTGDGKVVSGTDSGDMDDVTISGQSSTGDIVYPANQLVTVNGTWTLVKGANVVVKGQLDVPSGSKIVVESGATLSFTNGAVFNMEGTLVIESADTDRGIAAAVVSADFAEMNIEGTVNIAGTFSITAVSAAQNTVVNIKEGSAVTVAAEGTLAVAANAVFAIEAYAELTVNGTMNAVAISNYGTITINSSVPLAGNTTIYQLADGAAVDIQKLTIGNDGKTLTITDSGLVFWSKTENKVTTSRYVDQDPAEWAKRRQADSMTISTTLAAANYVQVITGLTVIEEVTSKASTTPTSAGYYDGKVYTNTMLVDGIVTTTPIYIGTGAEGDKPAATATLAVLGKTAVKVDEDSALILGLNVTLNNQEDSDFTVSGLLDADSKSTSPAAQATITNAGKITMSGEGLITYHTAIATGQGINAAIIETGTTEKINNYMTIDSAIAMLDSDGLIKNVAAVGTTTVETTATVPAGATITLAADGVINIGKSTKTDIVLTIAKDATLRGNGTINVVATLYAEQKTDVKGNEVVSDVKTEETDATGKIVKNGWAMWTNLSLALASAEFGSTVTITKDGNVELKGNTVVKEGVILVVPDTSGSLVLKNGVTLTINGVLITANDIKSETKFTLEARNLVDDKSSAIIVNGALYLPAGYDTYGNATGTAENQKSLQTGHAPIAGAYFNTDENAVISSLAYALAGIEDVQGAITLKGAISAADVIFEATDDCDTIQIGASIENIKTSFVVTSLTLDGSKLVGIADANSYFNGTVKVGEAAVKMIGARAVGANYTIADVDGKLTLSGALNIAQQDNAMEIVSGTVYSGTALVPLAVTSVTGAAILNDVVIADGATLAAADAASSFQRMMVNGTLAVPNEKQITVGVITVFGTVDIAASTSTKVAGNLTVQDSMYLGIEKKDIQTNVAGTAALNGAPTTNARNVYVAAGVTLDDAAKAALDVKSKLEIFVAGVLWFTAYGEQNFTLNKAPIDSAILTEWTKVEGSTAAGDVVHLNDNINPANMDVLYSVINEYIYSVRMVTDAGIKSVAIDGVQLATEFNANTFATIANLKAGVHTVSYTLMSGYSGTAQLYTADGTILKDLKFTASGLDYPVVAGAQQITLQLTGTEQSSGDQPEPTPVPEEEKSEWTITTILLVILVILIAILVVVLILRLNRS